MTKYDFALQWLEFQDIKVFNKGKQILKYDGDYEYEIKPLCTEINFDEEPEDTEEYTIMSWMELDSLGFAVKFDKAKEHRKLVRYQQGVHYIIRKRRNSTGISYDAFRAASSRYNLMIEHDPKNLRFRLKGDTVLAGKGKPVFSGVGDWVVYDKSFIEEEQEKFSWYSAFTGDEDDEEEEPYQQIEEINLGYTDEKYIVCMKKQKTVQRVIVVGESGVGKSLFVNAVAGRIFYKWDDLVGWLIDPLNQLYNLSAPQDNSAFNQINSWVNDMPRPLPVILLYMACKYEQQIVHENISYLLTLDFFEFLKKYKYYTFGIKEFDVGQTTRYMMKFIHEIKKVKSAKEIEQIMFANIPDAAKNKQDKRMIFKWVQTFETIFNEKFTSNLYNNNLKETHELKVKFPNGKELVSHPFIAAMEADLIPIINISAARRQKWLRNYLADLMQKIVSHQTARYGKDKRRMWIVADELNEIYEEKSNKRKDDCAMAFEELYRQGRINNIGFIGNTQSLSKLNPEMYDNATHVVCFHLKKPKDRRLVGDSFGLPKEDYDKIRDLDKYECMVLSREPFVIYDRLGRKKTSKRIWYKIKIFHPINYHLVTGK